MGKLDGRCMCGSVTYSSDADPAFVAMCHCKNCQRQTGTAFSVVVGVPADQVEVTGASLSMYATVGEDHGQDTNRHFCSACGSPIYSATDAMPGVMIIKAGTLDDTSWLDPQLEVWGGSAQEWVPAHETRPRMERGPGG
jgi:hypothetical protein